jgi:hypothetical protein
MRQFAMLQAGVILCGAEKQSEPGGISLAGQRIAAFVKTKATGKNFIKSD